MKLDEKDQAILQELLKDSKQTTHCISKKLNIPITTVHNRIKKLESQKIIKKFTVNVDYLKLGRSIPAFIGITVDYSSSKDKRLSQTEVARAIKNIEGVQGVAVLTGEMDILAKVIAKDLSELNQIVTEKLRKIPGVDKTKTSVILKEV